MPGREGISVDWISPAVEGKKPRPLLRRYANVVPAGGHGGQDLDGKLHADRLRDHPVAGRRPGQDHESATTGAAPMWTGDVNDDLARLARFEVREYGVVACCFVLLAEWTFKVILENLLKRIFWRSLGMSGSDQPRDGD